MDIVEQLRAQAATGGAAGELGITAGAMGDSQLEDLRKSLSAGYGTDMAGLTGGSALRIQSLDETLKSTVQENKHFTLFNRLTKPKATAVVDEWVEQSGVGGFLGGTFNSQEGAAMEATGEYQRQVGLVKYMSSYRKVPIILQRQDNIVDVVAREEANGSVQLVSDIEFSLYEGDDTVVPVAFAGLQRQMTALGLSDHIIDMAGSPLNSIDPISQACEVIFGFGNFGQASDIFLPPAVQTDLNNNLDPAFRIGLGNTAQSVIVGAHVSGIQTSFGDIKTNRDVFIRDEKLQVPFEVRPGVVHAAIAAANVLFKPVSITGVAAADALSAFTASHAGTYYYAVTGVNQNGETAAVLSAQITVAAGNKVTLTITSSAGGTETGYVIYRGRKNGTNSLTDLREMAKCARAGATTTYIDYNNDLPGATDAYVLSLDPSSDAISWRQYLPMLKIPMYPTNSPIMPWIQMICGYLRITKRKQHIWIKNIVPTGAKWKPFG